MELPRRNPLLIGHEAAEATLLAAAGGQRLHHAWLFGGPPGIGKATLAYRFARWLLAAPETSSCLALDATDKVFRRVAADTHADLMTVELAYDPTRKRQRTEIAVDDVRAVPEFLRLTPAEGGWRVVIVDGAEHMNRFGANALLKALEEPPARAVLILVSHTPGLLLPTLRSRCRALSLRPLADHHMQTLLAQALPAFDPACLPPLIALAEGSPGRALELAGADGLAYAELAAAILAELPVLDAARIQSVADRVGRGEGGFDMFMDMLRATLATGVRQAARGISNPIAQLLPTLRPLAAWSETWHALGRLQDETDLSYLDKRQAVVNALALLV